jgi:hypothetical protein
MQLVQESPGRATLYRKVTVNDGPVIPAASSAAGKLIQVTGLRFEYSLQPDGTWGRPKYSTGIEVYGPFLKKDKSHSANMTSFPLYREGEDRYQWMVKLAERMCPTGAVILRPAPGEWEADADELEI